MSKFFNPFNKKDRDALNTPNGKRGVQMAIIIAIVCIAIIIISTIMI